MDEVISLDDPIVYPFYIGIAFFALCTVYHTHLSKNFIGTYKDKIYYYFAHLITIVPIVIYSYNLFDIGISGKVTKVNYLKIFYIQWAFTTPLILMNLGRLCNFKVYKYIIITIIDIIMIMSGYISYISNNPNVIYSFYIFGCILYITLLSIFIKEFKVFNKNKRLHPPTHIYRDKIRYKCYKFLSIAIASLWILYPIIHILYKTNNLSIYYAVYMYVTLDILCKGIFTNLILGSREIYKPHTSFLAKLTKKVLRIHPLNNVISNNKLEEIYETAVSTASGSSSPFEVVKGEPKMPLNKIIGVTNQQQGQQCRKKMEELKIVIPGTPDVPNRHKSAYNELSININSSEQLPEAEYINECKRDMHNEIIDEASSVLNTKIVSFVPTLDSINEQYYFRR